ncbi:MAG: hypothetical protein JRI79_09135 [Deltaproteobacteria bacterium]|nr:hypothetical protein [Deltaproteobacteria bacterium]MBW1978113.1 hypothetical protein [Deltaproteobacteria bacterium]MBW2301624.1 hypothetical protein [Deltaproteobacteria bacterium]
MMSIFDRPNEGPKEIDPAFIKILRNKKSDPTKKGSIYVSEKCPLCNNQLFNLEPYGMFCLLHPDTRIICKSYSVRYGKIHKRFKSYNDAYQFLIHLRVSKSEGTLDERKYKRDNPLSFQNASDKFLNIIKAKNRSEKRINALECHFKVAKGYFQDRDIREIKNIDLDEFLITKLKHLAKRTQKDYLTNLRQFFKWLLDNDEINRLPKFPLIKVPESRAVRFARVEDFIKVFNKLFDLFWDYNFKIVLGCAWMATYSLRTTELVTGIKEKNITQAKKTGILLLPAEAAKIRTDQEIPLTETDLEFIRQLPDDIDQNKPFFRHNHNANRRYWEKQFPAKFLADKWAIAHKEALGIGQGEPGFVPLYHGTVTTMLTFLRADFTEAELKEASRKRSNAFERYSEPYKENMRKVYRRTLRFQEKRLNFGKGLVNKKQGT